MALDWIAPKYRDAKKLHAAYVKAKPFPHAVLSGFWNEAKIRAVREALLTESFQKKESDLFKLAQTRELRQSNHPVLVSFRAFLASKEFSTYMQTLTGVKLTNKDLDMGGSLYEDTDFLLCHDDQVTDRKIAYITYLNEKFASKDGGALVLFTDKAGKPGTVVQRYAPAWNTLAFFTVSEKSWHAVEEVTGRKARLSINGWFH